MSQFPGVAVGAPVDVPINDNPAADSRTHRVVNHALVTSARSVDELAERSYIRVIINDCREVELVAEDARQIQIVPSGNVRGIHDALLVKPNRPTESNTDRIDIVAINILPRDL